MTSINLMAYGQPNNISSYRGYKQKLTKSDPASQYQIQKLIQNTVGVYASLYASNLASLSAYQKPLNKHQLVFQAGTPYIVPAGVNWNQMSDRAVPSVQVVKTGSGSTYGASSTKHTIVRNRPGALSPGGIGVDIKHNSYDRYLNRLKGKGPLRRGVIPPTYGAPIPFNPAFPVYGGKTIKTSIINSCDCPINNTIDDKQNTYIYGNPSSALQDQIYNVNYQFNVGDYVWALKEPSTTIYYKAIILSIDSTLYTIQFEGDGTIIQTTADSLLIYYDCNCQSNLSLEEQVLNLKYGGKTNPYLNYQGQFLCSILSSKAASAIF